MDRLLAHLGIQTTRIELATSNEQPLELAQQIGFPCVLKISSADISHKSVAGGVEVSEKGVAAHPDPKRAVHALSRMAEYAGFLADKREPD